MIPERFEGPESQLSNDPGIIKNGSVYIKIRVPLKTYNPSGNKSFCCNAHYIDYESFCSILPTCYIVI